MGSRLEENLDLVDNTANKKERINWLKESIRSLQGNSTKETSLLQEGKARFNSCNGGLCSEQQSSSTGQGRSFSDVLKTPSHLNNDVNE